VQPDLELYVPRHVAAAEQRALRPEIVERRDPTAATRQLQYTSPGLPQIPAWDADKAFRFGYIANVIAYRCIQLRANALANVPIVVGPKRGIPRVDPENSPLARLLGPPPGGPAPKLSARKLIRWTVAQQIVTGRRAWEIETADGRQDGQPVAFWPLVSARLDAQPSDGGVEWFRVFRYGREGDKRSLAPGFVFYGWAPAGDDFRQAESALQSARFDLSLVTLADRYSMSFLQNNATPATVVITEAFPDDDHRRRFQSQWDSEYRGVDNAGRTRFHEVSPDGDGPVSDTIDVKVLGLSQRDAQLAEARKESLMEVAISLGTPWSKLDASGRTFDNAEVEDRSWWEDTNEPDMSDLEDDINMQLAPRLGGDVCWFDRTTIRALRNKVKPVTQSIGATTLVQSQLMTINEARADYGLTALPDGDRMMTVEEIQALKETTSDQAMRAALLAIESRGAGSDAPPAPHPEESEPPAPHPAEDRGPSPEDIEARRAKIWRTADAVVRTLEGRWERSMRRLFTRQQASTLARLTGKRGRQLLSPEHRDSAAEVDPAAIFDPAHWTTETREMVADLYEGVASEGLARVSGIFGIDFDLAAPWVGEFIEARANQLAGPVTQTTYDAITEQLRAGVAEGESIDDLAARVRHVFDVASQSRATVIARTEVISAYNGAAVQGAATLSADVVAGQEWIATRDGRTRSAHAAADGQVVPVGSPFEVGGDSLAYPGDPSGRSKNTVQCRCTVAFLTPKEMADLGVGRGRMTEHRHARALLELVNESTDLLAWRRALEAA
jgi:HK97 family phage portal protein